MKIMAMDEVYHEDLDMALDFLESDYFQAELQLELDEIAEKNRVSNTKFLGSLHVAHVVRVAPGLLYM